MSLIPMCVWLFLSSRKKLLYRAPYFFHFLSPLSTSTFILHILLCRWRWVIVVRAMLLIDEGELSSGLQQETLEDTVAAIHPPSRLHIPKLSVHTRAQTVFFLTLAIVLESGLILTKDTVASFCTLGERLLFCFFPCEKTKKFVASAKSFLIICHLMCQTCQSSVILCLG